MRPFLPTLILVGTVISIGAAYNCGQKPNSFINPFDYYGDYDHEDPRIAGGIAAVPHTWPWQVLLEENGKFACGGTIIANQWILTAAHCFPASNPDDLAVYVGVQNYNSPRIPLQITQIYQHPKYHPYTDENDIALLKLARPIRYNERVQPICLPSEDEDIVIPPNTAYATGWGAFSDSGIHSNELREVELPFIDFDECDQVVGGLRDGLQICAGKYGKDTCIGDSGGPLVVESSDGSWFQHGVVSVGPEKCGIGLPGLYTRVSGYCGWIERVTREAAVCFEPY